MEKENEMAAQDQPAIGCTRELPPAIACLMGSAPVAFYVPGPAGPVPRMAIPVRRGVKLIKATPPESGEPAPDLEVEALDLVVFLSPAEDLAGPKQACVDRLAAAGVRVNGLFGFVEGAIAGKEAGQWACR